MTTWRFLLALILLSSFSIPPQRPAWTADQPAQLASAAPLALRLRNSTYATFPGLSLDASIPQSLRQTAGTGSTFWLVQFNAPIQPEWIQALESERLAVVAYVADYAYIVWGEQPWEGARRAGTRLAAGGKPSPIHWTGAYHPAFRLASSLQTVNPKVSLPESVEVTVQFYNHAGVSASLARLEKQAQAVLQPAGTARQFVNISVRLAAKDLPAVAAWNDVFNVEPWSAPHKQDEIQGQLLAGNITSSGGKIVPTAPGYLAFLAEKGFPTDPAQYPIVDIVDDGIDQGDADAIVHPDFYEYGEPTRPDRVAYINNCTMDLKGDGRAGHGNLNAGIVGGYNDRSGFPYEDALGYQFGLGISPYGRIAGTKVFRNSGFWDTSLCGSNQNLVERAYNLGAKITSNSWGAAALGGYNSLAQIYDILTRDASSSQAGNQEMLHIIAAGNAGSSQQTLNSPGTAKNVLTVGASENVRDEGIYDGCSYSGANNADDIATFSSRGPAADGRIKPDLVAPGTHVQGPATQETTYDGSGVCGASGTDNRFYPAGQTLYTWSSGTSHSTPAVAGAAQLAYEYYGRVLQPGKTPSPAMLKALLLNTSRYLNGASSGDTLPSPSQGWGSPNLGMLFSGVPMIVHDQEVTFSASLQDFTLYGTVADPAQPLRFSLVWTDAPGSTTAAYAYVNNLNLEVTAGAQTYKGNVFNKGTSIPGGSFDPRNNVENVFLPAGVSGSFQVKVYAANIAGDAIPGNGLPLDQDFALVIYNAVQLPTPYLVNTGVGLSDAAGNQNGWLDPGEQVSISLLLNNTGDTTAAVSVASILVASGEATVGTTVSAGYADIAPGETRANAPPDYAVTAGLLQTCGAPIWLWQDVTLANGSTQRLLAGPIPTGSPTISNSVQYSSGDIEVAIPDGNLNGVKIPLVVLDRALVRDLDVRVSLIHPYVGDLALRLIAPSGRTVLLSSSNGLYGDNYTDTIFDDDAAVSITAGTPPFNGRFRPEEPLAGIHGESTYGTWYLWVQDIDPKDIGTVIAFGLDFKTPYCEMVAYRNILPLLSK